MAEGGLSRGARTMIWLFIALLLLGMAYQLIGVELRWLRTMREDGMLPRPGGFVAQVVVEWLSHNVFTVQRAFSFMLTGGALAWAVWRWGGRSLWYAFLVLALYGAAQSFSGDYIRPLTKWLFDLIVLIPLGVRDLLPEYVLGNILMAPWSAAFGVFHILVGLALIDARFRRSTPWWVLFFFLALLYTVNFNRLLSPIDTFMREAGLTQLSVLTKFGVDVGLEYALRGLAIAYAYRVGLSLTGTTDGEARIATRGKFVARAAQIYLILMIVALIGLTVFIGWRMFGGGGGRPSPVV